MAGLYIHIPFCRQACHYCDFHFSTNLSFKNQMIDMLIRELDLQKSYLGNETIKTIYFGGGSPSLLEPKELTKILEFVYRNYSVSSFTEITMEANPDDLELDYLKNIYSMGINRLSIGIQSFNDSFLKYLNRIHDSNSAVNCIHNSRKAGFNNISIDLIYGIPSENHSIFLSDLNQAIALETEHLSAYCLTIEPDTVFGRWEAKGKIRQVEDEFAAKQFEFLLEQTEKNGIDQYEISNFCRGEYYSKHNTNYWKGVKYLGIGPGAHSFNKNSRQYNISNNPHYIRSLQSGEIPFTIEELTKKDRINDYLLTSLRTIWGADLKLLETDYSFDISCFDNEISKAKDLGLLEIENNVLKLTKKGKFLADELTSRLMIG